MDNYAEFIDLGGNRLMIFAMQDENDGRVAWSVGTTSDAGVQVSLGSRNQDAVQELKKLKKAIDGAIKYVDAKQKDYVAKGKINDEPTI